jgi:hypothetical protein
MPMASNLVDQRKHTLLLTAVAIINQNSCFFSIVYLYGRKGMAKNNCFFIFSILLCELNGDIKERVRDEGYYLFYAISTMDCYTENERKISRPVIFLFSSEVFASI